MTAASVHSGRDPSDTSSSRLRRVAGSRISASSRVSTLSPRMWGRADFWVSRTYCRSAPAARTASGRSAQPNPARSRVPSWVASNRVELSRSKCQGGRRRVTASESGAFDSCSSLRRSSAGLRRSSSPASASDPSPSRTVKRPPARSSHASPKRSPSRNAAASSESRRSSSRASSVTVPGVTTRTTCRSTGPLDFDGSPICSQIATDSPLRTSRARYPSTLCTGTPAIGIGCPADWPREVKRDIEQPRRAPGVLIEELVEVPHAVEEERVRVLRLDAQVLLHDRGVL